MPSLSKVVKSHLKRFKCFLFFFLVGCGYHFESEEDQLTCQGQTLVVPYVQGDIDGQFTDALIKAIALSPHLTYAKEGELILEASLSDDSLTHIGWQYDRDPLSGDRINRLIPNEGRLELSVTLSLTSSRTKKVLHGPITVSAHSDFDFVDTDSLLDTSFLTPDGRRQSSLFFSLGQLDSREGALESSRAFLFHKLAKKIVRGIENLP